MEGESTPPPQEQGVSRCLLSQSHLVKNQNPEAFQRKLNWKSLWRSSDVYWFQNFDFHFTDWCFCLVIFIFTIFFITVSTMSDSENSDSEGLSENEELGLDEEIPYEILWPD